MSCVEFFIWFGSGIAIVPALELLKKLPGMAGAFFQDWAQFIAPILSVVAPIIAQAMQPSCATVDPLLWSLAYAALAYLVSQIVFWLGKQSGRIA